MSASRTEPKASVTAVVGVVFAVVVFVLIVALQWYFHRVEQAEVERKVLVVAPEELSQLRAKQEEQLNSYRWVDKGQNVITIPIDVAMRRVVEESGRSGGAAAPATRAGGSP